MLKKQDDKGSGSPARSISYSHVPETWRRKLKALQILSTR